MCERGYDVSGRFELGRHLWKHVHSFRADTRRHTCRVIRFSDLRVEFSVATQFVVVRFAKVHLQFMRLIWDRVRADDARVIITKGSRVRANHYGQVADASGLELF